MNAKKIQEEIEKNWYWDFRVERLESSNFFDDLILEYFDENDIVSFRFESCYEIHFQQDLHFEKKKRMKNCSSNEIPYYIQDVSVSEVTKKEDTYYNVFMNIWPMSLNVLCKDVHVSRKSRMSIE